MKISNPAVTLFALLLIFTLSCANGQSPVTPDESPSEGNFHTSLSKPHQLLGSWTFYVNEDHTAVDVVPVRKSADHWNVLKFLEQGPCTDCVKVTGITPNPSGTKTFDIEISHPFEGLEQFTGFDVRGITLFNGSATFSEAGVTVPDASQGDGELINADGYTGLYNSTTVGAGPGGLQGYLPGKFSTPTVPNASINGYKRHISTGLDNDRNALLAGDSVTVPYELDMPDGAFVFGYAVDASWVPPTVEPVIDPQTDFPPEANCPEPWKITHALAGDGLSDLGGYLTLSLWVYDYGGETSHGTPAVECPALWDGALPLTLSTTDDGYSKWITNIENINLAPAGNYRVLVRVEDNEAAGAPVHLDLNAWYVIPVEVYTNGGWARTWGGWNIATSIAVAISSTGDVYVGGDFCSENGVDFDPGPEEDIHTIVDKWDCFLSKFDQFGNHVWTRTFGGNYHDHVNDIAVFGIDNIWVTGTFEGTVDFDPSDAGVEERTSLGFTDSYLAKFDSDGNLTWVNVWGSSDFDRANALAWNNVDLKVYVTGDYSETVDFDPGPGIEELTTNGDADIYVAIYDFDGNYLQALGWGGTEQEVGNGICVDGSQHFYVAGIFWGTDVDFDPGEGTDPRDSIGEQDAFLTSFDPNGFPIFTRTWGGTGIDWARDVDCSMSGETYVTGVFYETADLNPYGGSDIHISNGSWDNYIACYSEAGAYNWGVSFGGFGSDSSRTVIQNGYGDLFIGGIFSGPCDFDPGPDEDIHDPSGNFLTKYSTDGTYQWTLSLEIGNPESFAMQADESLYFVGGFGDTVDFAPGPEVDEHTSNGRADCYLTKYLQDGTW